MDHKMNKQLMWPVSASITSKIRIRRIVPKDLTEAVKKLFVQELCTPAYNKNIFEV